MIDVEGEEIEPLRPLIEDTSRLDHTPPARTMGGGPCVRIGWLNVNRVYVHREERDILVCMGNTP